MNNFTVTVLLAFPFEGSEIYREDFTMSGESADSVRKRVRLMLADERYGVVVKKA